MKCKQRIYPMTQREREREREREIEREIERDRETPVDQADLELAT